MKMKNVPQQTRTMAGGRRMARGLMMMCTLALLRTTVAGSKVAIVLPTNLHTRTHIHAHIHALLRLHPQHTHKRTFAKRIHLPYVFQYTPAAAADAIKSLPGWKGALPSKWFSGMLPVADNMFSHYMYVQRLPVRMSVACKVYVCMYVCMHACMHVSVFVSMSVSVCVCVC